MPRTAVITSLYGDYDPLRPAPAGFDDAVCVSDRRQEAAGWRNVLIPQDGDPRLQAKVAKMTPFCFTDADAAVWIDASIEVASPNFARWALDHLGEHDLVVFEHPSTRRDIAEEAALCQDWPKYARWPIRQQVAAYRADGFPEGLGLYACGVIAWRRTDEAVAFGERWLEENRRWSPQDQISFPYLVWRTGKTVVTFAADQYDNEYFTIRWDERPTGNGPGATH
jgi:hypothetical protein